MENQQEKPSPESSLAVAEIPVADASENNDSFLAIAGRYLTENPLLLLAGILGWLALLFW